MGEPFFKYGIGSDSWKKLFKDAALGVKLDIKEGSASISEKSSKPKEREWADIQRKFEAAFKAKDIEKIQKLRKKYPHAGNPNDLQGSFADFGAGDAGWDRVIQSLKGGASVSKDAEESWEAISDKFRKALSENSIEKLKELRKQYHCSNPDDLGDGFSEFGAGYGGWGKVFKSIKEKLGTPKESWETIKEKFEAAFKANDNEQIQELRSEHDVYNPDDLQGSFAKFGSGSQGWDKVWEEVHERKYGKN